MSLFFTFLENFYIVDFKNIHFPFSSWNKTVLSFKNLFAKHLLLGKNMFLSSETHTLRVWGPQEFYQF